MKYKFSQQTKHLILFLSAIAILSSAPVFASPPAPTPRCRITGIVKSVNFKEAYNEACLKEPHGCPTDMELYHPARYFIDINIDSASYISGNTDFNTCDDMYPIGSVKNIFIGKDKVKIGDIFSVNQKIEGVVMGSSFNSYNIENLSKPKPSIDQKKDDINTMANPASVFCVESGGKLEIREGEGGQIGYCIFPDGSEYEEWQYFRSRQTTITPKISVAELPTPKAKNYFLSFFNWLKNIFRIK